MHSAKNPSVLVVDDSRLNVKILYEILHDEYAIMTADNGKQALQVLSEAKELPNIILLDLQMPQMSGREMFDILMADETLRKIPVIFITADSSSECELLAAGAADFISKPFSPKVVKLRVHNQIALRSYRESLEDLVAEKTKEVIKKTEEANHVLGSALQGLANVIEHRDLESGSHVKRTQFYVGALIKRLILSRSKYSENLLKMQPELIVKAMALHDVGKIAIPDRILLKPGSLSPEEYDVIKTHTVQGKRIIGELGDINGSMYLKHSEDICYSHHERWDGKGYPQGLESEEIPLVARLASLADVYDALVCARVYKKAFPYDEAAAMIADAKETQFDPIIVDAFLAIEDEFRKISEHNL